MSQIIPQSFATTTATAASSIFTINATKPTGLAVGEFLCAQVEAFDSTNGAISVALPSGWTSILDFGVMGRVMYKIADSSDVAASTFPFQPTANSTQLIATLSRFSNVDSVGLVNASHATSGGSTTTPSDTGITPTVESMVVMVVASRNASAVRTVSGYSVATSNPTWTEFYDNGYSAAGFMSLAMATATRPELTATGSATATISASILENAIGIFALSPAVVRPTSFLAGTYGLGTPTIPTIASAISAVYSFGTPVVEIITDTWTNIAKNVTTWTNQSKS